MRVLPLVGPLLLFASCAHSTALRARAAFDLRCAEAEVAVVEAGGVYEAAGCGARAGYVCSTVRMESRCEAAVKPPPLPADRDVPSGATRQGAAANRGKVDLACPEEQLEVRTFESGSLGVRGCGRRVAYVCRQRFWRYWCAADSPVLPDAGGPQGM